MAARQVVNRGMKFVAQRVRWSSTLYIGFAMKKFINRPEDVVEEMLQGMVMLHPGSARLPGHKVIVRADAEHKRNQQVAVISGGGSGHEPAHAGYAERRGCGRDLHLAKQ